MEERYNLSTLYAGLIEFQASIASQINGSPMLMGLTDWATTLTFVCASIWGYFYGDMVAYSGEDEDDVKTIFSKRLSYDIAVKLPYWYKKYNYIKTLLTTNELSLLQTSKMTSHSDDTTKTAGGSLQKIATTPTGVTTGTATDGINIAIGSGEETEGQNEIVTEGFVDKYTNTQQKYANASRIEGDRNGEIMREGSINELLDVLEKLPSSFADEVTKEVQKHFIFDYEGEEKGYYDETN